MSECDWVVRDAVREDESCIVPMWIKQLVKGDEAKGARGRGASPSWSDEEFLAFYAEMHPIVEGLLRSGATVRVACDPERAEYTPARWDVVDSEGVPCETFDNPDDANTCVQRMRRDHAHVDIAYVAAQRAIIHAWSATDGDILYGVGIDKKFKAAGFGADLALAVLGDAHKRPMRMRLDIVDVKPPSNWIRERGWSASLRAASSKQLANDATYARVVQHVFAADRVPWKPREKRAA